LEHAETKAGMERSAMMAGWHYFVIAPEYWFDSGFCGFAA